MRSAGKAASMPRTVLVLAGLMAVSGLMLGIAFDALRGRIEAHEAAKAVRVAHELTGTPVSLDTETTMLCDEQGRHRLLVRSAARGYGGVIELLTLFDHAGESAAVRILKHSETPGFADHLRDDSDWLAHLAGSRSNEEVDAVSGATITSNAVLLGLEQARRLAADAVANDSMQPGDCPP